MLIAQITDIHLGFEPDHPGEMNRLRLDETVAKLCALNPRPEFLLCTGDLTDRGDISSYARLREALEPLPFPYFLAVGNHDLRGPLLQVFPEVRTAGGFVQYVIDRGPLRVIVLDTLEQGRHAGAFGPDRARWLEERLKEAPHRPSLIVLHHPPVHTGIDWMTLGPEESWAPALTALVSRHKQVVGAIAGHVHRPIVAPWAGTTLRVCPSCAPQVTLDLAPMDLDHPDNRPLIQEEPPGFALHLWTGGQLITHYGRVEAPQTLLRFDEGFQPVLRHFDAEKRQEPKYPGEGGRNLHSLLSIVFGVAGRIGRRAFWLASALTAGVGACVYLGLSHLMPPSTIGAGIWPLWVALAVIVWPMLAILIKRAHDRNRPAAWLFLALIPVVGTLWVLLELAFAGASAGAIRFGVAPRFSA